jgi:peptidoglycan L-alanyl-D-glutamate endopeptidase CwlK
MTYTFSQRSESNLTGVHPGLVAVVRKALEICETDFTVVEGLRTLARQKELVARGASQTMNSRHLKGEAVDLYPFYDGRVQVSAPHGKFRQISLAMTRAAAELGLVITWGGTWKTLVDMPHYQIEL